MPIANDKREDCFSEELATEALVWRSNDDVDCAVLDNDDAYDQLAKCWSMAMVHGVTPEVRSPFMLSSLSAADLALEEFIRWNPPLAKNISGYEAPIPMRIHAPYCVVLHIASSCILPRLLS